MDDDALTKNSYKEKYHDPMEVWNKTMSDLIWKERWDSLSYWQKMCEIAALRKYFNGGKSLIDDMYKLY